MRALPVHTDLGPDPEPLGQRFERLLDRMPPRTNYRRPARSSTVDVQYRVRMPAGPR